MNGQTSPSRPQPSWWRRFWRGQYFSGPLDTADSLRYWRERVLFFLYLFGALGGLVSVVLDLWYWLPRGQEYIAIQTSLVLVTGWLVLLLGRRLPYAWRAGVVLLLLYAMGLSLLLRLGPVSNALPILMCFNLVAALLFGLRGALFTWLALALTLGGILLHLQLGGLPRAIWGQTSSRLLVLFGNFLLFSGLASAGVAALVHGLQSTVEAERQAKQDLARQSARLEQANQRLTQEAQARGQSEQARGQSEQALLQAQERFRTVLDSLDALVYLADLETYELLFYNRKTLETLGPISEGQPCWRALQKGQDGPCQFCTNYLLLDVEGQPLPQPYVWEFYNPLAGRWYALHERALRWLDGRLVRLTVAVDISQRVAAEEDRRQLEGQLRQAQKMEAVGTLAGGIAHDFNNILAAILGQAESGLVRLQGGQDGRAQLEKIVQAALRARDLIGRIMAFSRKAQTRLEPLDLNQDLGHVVQMLKHTIPKMIAIETHLAVDLLPVIADASQMQQVIFNLATNAMDAMPQGGRLVLETANVTLDEAYCRRHLEVAPGAYVRLMVSDTGQGMDKTTLEQAFNPFFTTKAVGRGTGLGLSTVHGIVKAHRGHIFAYSEPGLGACFKIYLPALTREPQATQAPPPLPEELLGGSETILLVDDEETLRELGAMTLEEMGYRTLTADSGEQALELYRAQGRDIDLVILDLGMPGMGGQQCLRQILALNPLARVMIASGYSANGPVRESLQGGAMAFVAKPFRRVDLLATVREVLDQPRVAAAGDQSGEAET